MKKFKNKKGITLTSLVITIIILIVLASVGTYSGIQIVNSSKLTAFTTELKIMQTEVNELYQKFRDKESIRVGNDTYVGADILTIRKNSVDPNISTNIDNSSLPIYKVAEKVFTAEESGVENKEGYLYFNKKIIEDLSIEGVEGEFFVNIERRSVISCEGFQYKNETYYTLEQLPDSMYNVNYIGTIEVQGNPTQWTNNDVTLTVVPSIEGTILTEYSFDGGINWTTSNSKVYTENTNNIKIFAKDKYGQILKPANIDITKIDKEPPTVTFENNTEYEVDGTPKQVENLVVSLGDKTSVFTGTAVTDAQSGIKVSGVKCYRNDTEITNTDYFTHTGRYKVVYKVQDKVGNENEIERQILVRWPLAGKYIAKETELNGAGIVGEGNSSSTSPDGLYKDSVNTGYNSALPFSSKYYYTGATVNNYLSFAGRTFRILNIASNYDIKLLGDISDVGTSWGSNKIFESNVYTTWSTKWWTRGQIYNNETNESKYMVFSDAQKAHIDLATFYAGRVDKNNDLATTISNEQTNAVNLGNSSASFQGYSAYPNASDFLKASKCHETIKSINDIDTASVQSRRTLFKNNSWVDMNAEFWTMNGRTGTLMQDSDFWVIDNDLGGHFESRLYSSSQQYRVVIYLKNNTILSGTGTVDDPFKVEENWGWFDSKQNPQ